MKLFCMKSLIFKWNRVHLYEFQICLQVIKPRNIQFFFIPTGIRSDPACWHGNVWWSHWFDFYLSQISFLGSHFGQWEAQRNNVSVSSNSSFLFLDQLQWRCGCIHKHTGAYINTPLTVLILQLLVWTFPLSQCILPPRLLLYFTLIYCWVCTPTFAVQTASYGNSQYFQTICCMYLILRSSCNGNCLKFIYSLGWLAMARSGAARFQGPWQAAQSCHLFILPLMPTAYW